MRVNENEFFRQTTIHICSSPDIKKAALIIVSATPKWSEGHEDWISQSRLWEKRTSPIK
ncbi:MAG: hypothetical protein V2B19_12095 [Pseudomonadota bacterium]